VTLGTTASSVTFSSIPATYRDLILVSKPQQTLSNTETPVRFNGDSGTNYSQVVMFGNGSTTGSFGFGGRTNINIGTSFTGSITQSFLQIMDYSATDKHKTTLLRVDNSADATAAGADRWANTAAITSINISVATGTFAAGSTFSLYGVIA
jgi:hypothetical protein